VRNAKAKDKPYKLADGGGLYLEVMPSGGKLWRMKFRHEKDLRRVLKAVMQRPAKPFRRTVDCTRFSKDY
jgi:hypothetical protein